MPARADPSSGYRRYAEDQVKPARLAGYLRRAGMPLARIASVLAISANPVAARARGRAPFPHTRLHPGRPLSAHSAGSPLR